MNEDLVLVTIPSLIAILLRAEEKKGASLTQEEVIAIRDRCHYEALPLPAKAKLEESRGYRDIDPENVWDEWQIARMELAEDD